MSTRLSPTFKVSKELLEFLSGRGRKVHFDEGDTIINEGDCSNDVYVIMSGKVDILKQDEYGNMFRVTELDSGSVIGEMGAFLQNRRSATVVAQTDVRALSFNEQMFQRALIALPELSFRIMTVFAQRVANLVDTLTDQTRGRLMYVVGRYILDNISETGDSIAVKLHYDKIKQDTGLESYKVLDALNNFMSVDAVQSLSTTEKQFDDVELAVPEEFDFEKEDLDTILTCDSLDLHEIESFSFRLNVPKLKIQLKKLSYVP